VEDQSRAFYPHSIVTQRGRPRSMSSPLARIRIVLCATSHPGNIGASARAMQTMGLTQLVLVDPLRFPDAAADAMASSASGILKTARVVSTLDESLEGVGLAVGF